MRRPLLARLLVAVIATPAGAKTPTPAAIPRAPGVTMPVHPKPSPHASGNGSNTAFRNQMKKFSNPLGAKGGR